MVDDLESERLRLLARLAVLQSEHDSVRARPHDLNAHAKHRADLRVYQADVHAYRDRLAAMRQERGLPDPDLFG